MIATKIASVSKENKPTAEDIIKNQKENPAVTANALNLEEYTLNWYVKANDEEYTTFSDTGQFVLTRSLLDNFEKPIIFFDIIFFSLCKYKVNDPQFNLSFISQSYI